MSFRDRHSEENKDDQQYVYHYSNQKFSEVKTRKMLRLPAPKEASNPDEYNQMISLLPSPLSKETITKYRASGFKAWGTGPLYEYKISVPKNVSAFVGDIKMTSVPESLQFFRRFPYDKYFKDNGVDRPRLLKDDDYWEGIKDKYNVLRSNYIDKKDNYIKHMIAPALTARNYATHSYIAKIKDTFDYWIDFNFHKGSKEQYASYIPHLHTKIDKPLIPEMVIQII